MSAARGEDMGLAPERPSRAETRRGAGALALLCVLAVATVLRLAPPAPSRLDAPASTFSAERARSVLTRLSPGELPHPAGSAEQREVRRRLLAELRALGLEPEEQVAVVCSGAGICAELHNVV